MSETAEMIGSKVETIAPKKSEKSPMVEEVKKKVEKALVHFGDRTPGRDLEMIPLFHPHHSRNAGFENVTEKPHINLPRLSTDSREYVEWVAKFKGQLSTDPKKVGEKVNQINLTDKCDFFSQELYERLKREGVNSNIIAAKEHSFLTTNGEDGEIIIDSAIGQFLKGYNHVFVGTRDELEKLVSKYADDGKLSVIIDTYRFEENKISVSEVKSFIKDNWEER